MSDLEANIKITLSSDSASAMLEQLALLLKEKHSIKNDKWIDSREAMELLRVSKNTLQKLRDTRAIRVSKPPHIDKFYYDRESILEYLEKHAQNPES